MIISITTIPYNLGWSSLQVHEIPGRGCLWGGGGGPGQSDQGESSHQENITF